MTPSKNPAPAADPHPVAPRHTYVTTPAETPAAPPPAPAQSIAADPADRKE